MTLLKNCLLPAVLATCLWAFGQQPASPAPPPAGTPPSSPGTTAAPSSDQAAQPPDAPAPAPSKDAGQNPSAPANAAQGSSSGEAARDNSANMSNSGRALTSNEVRTQISTTLRGEPGLSSRNIKVDVTDNAVVLSGTVPTSNQSLLAQRIAHSYAGTRRVTNNLNVATGEPGANGSEGPSGQPQQATPPPDAQGGQGQPPQ
jgi:hypothetical protein